MKHLILTFLLSLFISANISFADTDTDTDISCVQPTVYDCSYQFTDTDTDADIDLDVDINGIMGTGYIAVPVQNMGQASCVTSADTDVCDGGIRDGMPCEQIDTDTDTDCPKFGCITDNCTTNKLAWSVDVIDRFSSYLDPNPCAMTSAKWDFQCSDNVEPGDIPADCTIPSDDDDVSTPTQIVCPVEFQTSIENCMLVRDDDDSSPTPLILPPGDDDDRVIIINPGIGVSLSGKNLYNPASGGRQMGGKNKTRNGINQTGIAHCSQNSIFMPSN